MAPGRARRATRSLSRSSGWCGPRSCTIASSTPSPTWCVVQSLFYGCQGALAETRQSGISCPPASTAAVFCALRFQRALMAGASTPPTRLRHTPFGSHSAAATALLLPQGLKHAVPKNILTMMNVEGMTRENVASHLQVWEVGERGDSRVIWRILHPAPRCSNGPCVTRCAAAAIIGRRAASHKPVVAPPFELVPAAPAARRNTACTSRRLAATLIRTRWTRTRCRPSTRCALCTHALPHLAGAWGPSWAAYSGGPAPGLEQALRAPGCRLLPWSGFCACLGCLGCVTGCPASAHCEASRSF